MAATVSRPYHVITPTEQRLVEAINPSAAIRHVVKTTISASARTAKDVAILMSRGLRYEQANAEQANAEQDDLPGMPAAEVSAT